MPRWVLFAFVLALLGGALLIALDEPLPVVPGVTEANVARIQRGMTVEQVEAVLGGPGRPTRMGCSRAPLVGRKWEGPRGTAVVFLHGDRVMAAEFTPAERPSTLARFLARLGFPEAK